MHHLCGICYSYWNQSPHKNSFIYFAAEEKSVFKGKKLVSVNSTDYNLGVSFLSTCSDFHMQKTDLVDPFSAEKMHPKCSCKTFSISVSHKN